MLEESEVPTYQPCPICLESEPIDKAILETCFHGFCFECIKEWSFVSNQCPICKRPLETALHSIQSDSVFERYTLSLPDLAIPQSDTPAQPTISTRRRPRTRTQRPRSPPRQAEIEYEQSVQFRRRVYLDNLYALHVGSNPLSQYSSANLTPQHFRSAPSRLDRLRPWLRRELQAILQISDVELLIHYIEALLQRCHIQTQEAITHLRQFLHEHTEHFVHELICFAKSPFDMHTFDSLVQYGCSDTV